MTMERRTFLKLCAALGVSLSAPSFPVLAGVRKRRDTPLHETARNCIFINMLGGPSHVDTFDFKPGAWTPDDFGGTTLPNGAAWPDGVMPRLAQLSDRFSLIRSMYAGERNHQRAQYLIETANPFNPASLLRAEIPPMGSLVSREFAGSRTADDVLPTFFSINHRSRGTGMLAREHGSFFVSKQLSLDSLAHPHGNRIFDRRLTGLFEMDPLKRRSDDPVGLNHLWQSGAKLMSDERVVGTFTIDSETLARYGGDTYGSNIAFSLALAYQLLASEAGARFIHVGYSDWDHHFGVYNNLSLLLPRFDQALASLILDLEATPGQFPGKSLLDETVIVAIGEFGRTPGALNSLEGRDHFSDAFAALIAGGGVQGGRVIGETNALGAEIVDPGWQAGRPVSFSDVAATIYSAMGIDYRGSIDDTPSGRRYLYVAREAWAGFPEPIEELFT